MRNLWPFGRASRRRQDRERPGRLLREIPIQGATPEGGSRRVLLESLLTGLTIGDAVPGTINGYTTYDAQVQASYDKYNGQSSFGGQQTRAVADLRTAFIAGEGISVSGESEATSRWIEQFLSRNQLDGTGFVNAVKGSELAGQSLFLLRMARWIDGGDYVRATRVPYALTRPYKPVFADKITRDEVVDIMIRREGQWQRAGFSNFVYVRTGGDDGNYDGPTTKIGVVLTDIENYDRAIRDMRRNNHIFARITPVWETGSDDETKSLEKTIRDMQWKIGKAWIGRAKFHYETPETGAHENLESELAATVKTISAVTGVPVHWLGFVDLMSNRATAESLYELVKNATLDERVTWQASLYEMIVKAQRLYIDSGGRELPALDFNFEVRLPLIDFANFLNRVQGLSLALSDEAIAIEDYRNNLPGIDPIKTARLIEARRRQDEESMKTRIPALPEEEAEGEEE